MLHRLGLPELRSGIRLRQRRLDRRLERTLGPQRLAYDGGRRRLWFAYVRVEGRVDRDRGGGGLRRRPAAAAGPRPHPGSGRPPLRPAGLQRRPADARKECVDRDRRCRTDDEQSCPGASGPKREDVPSPAGTLIEAPSGRLRVHKGRITALDDAGPNVCVTAEGEGGERTTLKGGLVVNCTGPQVAFPPARIGSSRISRAAGLCGPTDSTRVSR